MCTSRKFLLAFKSMINLGFRLKCFPFYIILTKYGIRLKFGTKKDILQWRNVNIVYIMFKLFCIYGLGIYTELTDPGLKTNERIQYYFVVSCETLALACMSFVVLFAERIRALFDSVYLFESKMRKCYNFQ